MTSGRKHSLTAVVLTAIVALSLVLPFQLATAGSGSDAGDGTGKKKRASRPP